MSCSVLNRVRQYQAYDVETLFEQLGEIEMNLDAVADARSQDEVLRLFLTHQQLNLSSAEHENLI